MDHLIIRLNEIMAKCERRVKGIWSIVVDVPGAFTKLECALQLIFFFDGFQCSSKHGSSTPSQWVIGKSR